MKLEEARALRDLAIFTDQCNLPGIAKDHYDEAFRIFRQCGAVLEIQKILDRISPDNAKNFWRKLPEILLIRPKTPIRFVLILFCR
jgi:hypothetical protein